MTGWTWSVLVAVLGVGLFAGGCVEQTLTVQTNPPASLVLLNGQELGRTPVNHPFLWYGKYEVVVRHEGYQTLRTTQSIDAPVYQWIPIDLVSALLPFTIVDHHVLNYTLQPLVPGEENSEALVKRGIDLRGQLQSPRVTTRPTSDKSH